MALRSDYIQFWRDYFQELANRGLIEPIDGKYKLSELGKKAFAESLAMNFDPDNTPSLNKIQALCYMCFYDIRSRSQQIESAEPKTEPGNRWIIAGRRKQMHRLPLEFCDFIGMPTILAEFIDDAMFEKAYRIVSEAYGIK